MLSLFAESGFSFSQNPFWDHFWSGLILSGTFGFVGIVMLLLGYFLFELITPRLDVQKELSNKNTAVGIVVGALLLGIAYIVAHVVQ